MEIQKIVTILLVWLDKHSNQLLAITAICALLVSLGGILLTINPPEKKARISAFYTVANYSELEKWVKIYFYNGGNAPCVEAKFSFMSKPEPPIYYRVINDYISIEEYEYDYNLGVLKFPATQLLPHPISCPANQKCVYGVGYILPNSITVIAIPLKEVPTMSLIIEYSCANAEGGVLNVLGIAPYTKIGNS